MKRVVQVVSFLVIAAVAAASFAWTRLTTFLSSPVATSSPEKVIVVPKDTGPEALATLLEGEGLVMSGEWLRIYFRHFARPPVIQPGEYALSAAMAPIDLLRRVASGKVVTHTVAVPPGARAKEIVELLAARGLADGAELEGLVFDERLATELGVAGGSLEGYLFPDAYALPRGLAPRALLGLLVARYRKAVTPALLESARARGLTEHELVTLASLIERSEVLPDERRIFAGLLLNRIAAGYPLEIEPSADYGVERLGLTVPAGERAALDHPWNTMVRTGLPPTPIASPSLASLQAAADPATSAMLFMVERADGTHVFCPDVECWRAELERWHPGVTPRLPRRAKPKR